MVAKSAHIRYCGSPIALSFDELGTQKNVLIAEFSADKLTAVTPVNVPAFQAMAVIKGNLSDIANALEAYQNTDDNTWLCIEVQTDDYLSDLQQRIAALCEGKAVEVLQLRRSRSARQTALTQQQQEVLTELRPEDVFERRLAQETFSEDCEPRLARLRQHFARIVAKVEQGVHE